MNHTTPIRALLLACLLGATPVHAQSLFQNVARNVSIDLARKAVTDKVADTSSAPAAAASPATPATAPAPGCPRARGTPMAPLGPRPDNYLPAELWPDEGCNLFSFNDLTFKAAKAQRQAFDEAARVPCTGCEGGRSYDSWAHHFLYKGGDYKGQLDTALLALVDGKSIEWKGQKYFGAVRLTGTEPIGDFACRQYQWTLMDAKKKVLAERPGLYCEYKRPYAASANWHEVI